MSRVLGWAMLEVCLVSCEAVYGGMVGTGHDFSSMGLDEEEVCRVCHYPDDENRATAVSALWSQAGTESSTDASVGSRQTTASHMVTSGFCLSCHDGTSGPTVQDETHLSRIHPISIRYDRSTANAKRSLRDPTTAASGLGGTIAEDMLFDGKLECISCHDIHNAGGNRKLLRKDNTGSALCLTCHSV